MPVSTVPGVPGVIRVLEEGEDCASGPLSSFPCQGTVFSEVSLVCVSCQMGPSQTAGLQGVWASFSLPQL